MDGCEVAHAFLKVLVVRDDTVGKTWYLLTAALTHNNTGLMLNTKKDIAVGKKIKSGNLICLLYIIALSVSGLLMDASFSSNAACMQRTNSAMAMHFELPRKHNKN